MIFKISSNALYTHLVAASRVLQAKNSMPILGCFYFKFEGGQLTIIGSDGEKYYITSLPTIEQDSDEVFCIPASTIIDSMKELPEQPIQFEYDTTTHVLKGAHQSGTFVVMTQDAASYPMPQAMEESVQRLVIPADVLINGVTRCLFATANEEVRLVMTGVYLDIKEDCVTFAGTDGRKLVRNINRSVQPGYEGGIILPKKVAAVLKAVVSRPDGDFTLSYDTKKALIESEDFKLYFSLVEGNYPNYNAVIPTNNPYHATVDRASLISALKRVGIFTNQSSGLIKLHIDNNTMTITGQDLDFNTSAVENLICEYTDQPISIGFSCQFLQEIATFLPGESVTIHLADPSRPGIVTPSEQDPADDVIMLIMPMMLSE